MKTFKQYLSEMPLNQPLKDLWNKQIKAIDKNIDVRQNKAEDSEDSEDYDVDWDDESLNQYATHVYKVFRQYAKEQIKAKNLPYKQFSQGHSGAFRQPVLMPVISKLFTKKELGYMGAPKKGSVKTIIKVALSSDDGGETNTNENMELNGTEWEVWQSAKKDPIARKWLCPVVDCSKDLFPKLKEDYNGMLFIQMPFCDTSNVDARLEETFGIVSCGIEFFDWCGSELPRNVLKMRGKDLVKEIVQSGEHSFVIDDELHLNTSFGGTDTNDYEEIADQISEELQNIREISYVIQKYRLEDLHWGNWGDLNGHLVVLDYGGVGGVRA